MKQLLFFLFLLVVFIKVEAQDDIKKGKFALVSIRLDAGQGMYEIRIDTGQAPITKKASIMKDGSGNPILFVSPAAALNFFDGLGWKLQKVLNDSEAPGGIGSNHSFLFRKDY